MAVDLGPSGPDGIAEAAATLRLPRRDAPAESGPIMHAVVRNARWEGARVWIIRLAAVDDGWPGWRSALDAPEVERMNRFVRAEDRHRFGVTRAMLRKLLAEVLGRPPPAVTFAVNRFGRPRLADDPGTGLCFSVSHSGDYALIGLAFHRPIGVDVERARPGTTLAEVAPTICSPAELQEVSRLGPGERTADLYRRWTIKEAYIKALGVGLSYPPGNVGLSRRTDAGSDQAWTIGVRGRWTLILPDIAPGYSAAVTVFGANQPVDLRRMDGSMP